MIITIPPHYNIHQVGNTLVTESDIAKLTELLQISEHQSTPVDLEEKEDEMVSCELT